MKKHWCLVLWILVLILRQPTLSETSEIEGEYDDEDGFVQTRGVQLILKGSPYYVNGFNAYWLMVMASDPSQRDKVTSAFEQASSHGLTLARTWAFSDGGDFMPLQVSPGSYNELTFQGLDFVVSEAKEHGIKLVMSLVNNHQDFGGKRQYVEWARSVGESIDSEDEFFTNPIVKGFYKDHVKAVLTRYNTFTGVYYKDDPTIMAWELMNEPRCTSDLSGNTVQDWIAEMASYLKSIDGNHLLEVGSEGFYNDSGSNRQQNDLHFQVGTDFIANNQITGIDLATVHSYPDQWLYESSEETQLSFLNDWINSHIEDAENVLQKPVLFSEFGKFGYNASERDKMFSTIYDAIDSSACRGGAAAGGMFWQLLTEGMDAFRDGYEVVLTESLSASTADLITQQSWRVKDVC